MEQAGVNDRVVNYQISLLKKTIGVRAQLLLRPATSSDLLLLK